MRGRRVKGSREKSASRGVGNFVEECGIVMRTARCKSAIQGNGMPFPGARGRATATTNYSMSCFVLLDIPYHGAKKRYCCWGFASTPEHTDLFRQQVSTRNGWEHI